MNMILDYTICIFLKLLPPCRLERYLIRLLMRIRET